jgi:hypothetical protein
VDHKRHNCDGNTQKIERLSNPSRKGLTSCCTFSYMTDHPARNATDKLALWESAMKTLRDAERQLEAARRKRSLESVFALHAQVQELRTRADLLLAKAIEVTRDSISPARS